jgi:hypothetical protein
MIDWMEREQDEGCSMLLVFFLFVLLNWQEKSSPLIVPRTPGGTSNIPIAGSFNVRGGELGTLLGQENTTS